MKCRHSLVFGVFMIAGALAAGCASTPRTTQLDRAVTTYDQAKNDPTVTTHAPVLLYEAEKALDQANTAESIEEQRHYAFIAEKKVELARANAELEAVRTEVINLKNQQQDFLLELQRREAIQAEQRASLAQDQLRAYREQEVRAQQQELEQAKLEAMQAQQQLSSYREQEQRKQLEEARMGAERAQSELAKLQQELSDLQARKTEKGTVLTLSDVLFEVNEAQLKPGARRSLDRIASYLRENPERKVLIEGFTDSVGSESYNQKLSENRAEAVAEALKANGVGRERLSTKGLGESYPVATNETAAGRQQNRRVEITILDEKQNP